jgi:TonB family protein
MSLDLMGPCFALLPDRRSPWREFGLSVAVQSAAILILVWVGVLHPDVLVPAGHDYHIVQLVSTSVPVRRDPAPVRVIPAPVARVDSSILKVATQVAPKQTPIPIAAAPKIEIASKASAPIPPAATVIPRQLVKTEVFSSGSSALPTIARAPQQVQTGGFGDPNGVAKAENKGKPVTIAPAGSFDMPTGAGYGNGSGGATGSRGVVASAGFGNGTAISDGSATANTSRGTVRQSGFGDSDPAPVASKVKPASAVVVNMAPPEITSKPTPAYTDEARKLRIEGEVLLEVVFESTGRLHVVRVVRGLGHGLDEAARQAAEQIRFKPALRDGHPSDATAVLHIVFQLA